MFLSILEIPVFHQRRLTMQRLTTFHARNILAQDSRRKSPGAIGLKCNVMAWAILLDEEFAAWLGALLETPREEILAYVELLRERGPKLGRPYADTVKSSRYSNMKELRIQIAGDPWRVLFAFDPRRSAVLLVGGNKGPDKRWYKTNVPLADKRFAKHLKTLA